MIVCWWCGDDGSMMVPCCLPNVYEMIVYGTDEQAWMDHINMRYWNKE